ncbi:hypothetical protein UFOVP276_167 [uncultured Caudovirales phage]|uniref:Uncharacterized protein n=1 Tax=uncultured Caudovirales phage TaxID=2100421 RepID=A0A6J5LLZ1_9CAUD|nr:hypothetical protein UFOVP127_61 [uncultured Caudovirales phage]CAB4135211.1 hypothetical protein UFOVP276_167 [uncultured Caudovirales phage]
MRIVGFAQTMRLDGSVAQEGYELKLQLDNGVETTVPTSQETVLALTKLWAENRSTTAKTKQYQEVEETFPPLAAEEEDDETTVFGGSASSVAMDDFGYPVVKAETMPRPRFLDSDDEDGNQV